MVNDVDLLFQVRSFSQLRNEFSDVDTFYLGTGGGIMSPLRRSRSRGAIAGPVVVDGVVPTRRRARSKSRPRALYQEAEVVPAATGRADPREVVQTLE
ncbi:unnamed protein product, partial [Nesidiocoris tenuis]